MKSMVLLCFLCCLVVCVRGQTNYLMASFDSAMDMKAYYDHEVNAFREELTKQTSDMGHYFTEKISLSLAEASTPAQGAAIQACAVVNQYDCGNAIDYMDYYIRTADRAGNRLHSSVIEQLSQHNIKEYDLEIFYYNHNTRMAKAFEDLWYVYSDNMFYAMITVIMEFFYIQDDLVDCLDAALLV